MNKIIDIEIEHWHNDNSNNQLLYFLRPWTGNPFRWVGCIFGLQRNRIQWHMIPYRFRKIRVMVRWFKIGGPQSMFVRNLYFSQYTRIVQQLYWDSGVMIRGNGLINLNLFNERLKTANIEPIPRYWFNLCGFQAFLSIANNASLQLW